MRRRRSSAATAADAPNRPPRRNVRIRSRRCSPSTLGSYDPSGAHLYSRRSTLDVVVRLAGTIAAGADTPAQTHLSAGGRAANVAAWAAELGAQARFIGKRGNDEAGRLAARDLEARGVGSPGLPPEKGGVICALVDRDGERWVLSDRGSATAFRPDELDPGWLEGCDHLFVSGYALFDGPTRATARTAVELAGTGLAVGVDLASWSALEENGAAQMRTLIAELRPDVVFANEDEDRMLGGPVPGTVCGSSSAASTAARSTATSAMRCRSRRSWIRQAPATRSRRASSSAAPTSRSRRRPGASRD